MCSRMFCRALPGLVVTLTSKEKSDKGIPASVVVDRAYSVTLPAVFTNRNVRLWSQLIVTGTYSLSVIFTLAKAGPPCR